jgi:hypothetical protein
MPLASRSVAMIAIARVEDGEDCVLPQKIVAADALPLTEVDAQIRHAKDAPIAEVPAFRKVLLATRLPLVVTSVAAYGAGELHALSPGPFILSYGVVGPDQTIDVVIRWDHRITDAALIAKALTRLEQVLNTEIAAELRSQRQQAEPKQVRAVAT